MWGLIKITIASPCIAYNAQFVTCYLRSYIMTLLQYHALKIYKLYIYKLKLNAHVPSYVTVCISRAIFIDQHAPVDLTYYDVRGTGMFCL